MYPFSADPAEYIRDCCFYLAGIGLVTWVLHDGYFTLFEGLMLLCLYAAYVTVAVTFDQIRHTLGLNDAEREEEHNSEDKEHKVPRISYE